MSGRKAASASRGRDLWRIMHDAAVNTLKRPRELRWPFTGTTEDLKRAVLGTHEKLNPGKPRCSGIIHAYRERNLTRNEAEEALEDIGLVNSARHLLNGTPRRPRRREVT